MGDVLLRLAVGFEPAGTGNLINIADGAAINLTDGIVLGDGESGTGNTGIDLTTEARMRPKPAAPGSVSRADDFFVQEDISTFSFAFPFAGNRKPRPGTPAGDGSDFDPDLGILTLLNAAGLIKQTGTATGSQYRPGVAVELDAMVWDGGNNPPTGNKKGARNFVQQGAVNSLALVYDAGSVPLATCDLVGALTPDGSGGFVRDHEFPAPDYQEQASIAPPLVAAVSGEWSGTERCFQSLTITLDNAIQNVQDSCKIDGFRRSPTLPRNIEVSGTMIVNDADFDAEWEAMTNGSTASASYTFTIGTAAGSGEPMLGHQVTVSGIRVTSHQVVEIDETGLRGIAFEGYLSAATAGQELLIEFI